MNSNKDETRNVLLEQIKQNELMSKKPKKVCTTLNYLEHFCILASGTNGCFSFCAFAFLLGTSICITSSAIGLKLCVINKWIKKFKSTIKKEKKMHDKIVLLTKSKLNNIEVLISKALLDLNTSHEEFVLTNSVLKEYKDMKEQMKNLKT